MVKQKEYENAHGELEMTTLEWEITTVLRKHCTKTAYKTQAG